MGLLWGSIGGPLERLTALSRGLIALGGLVERHVARVVIAPHCDDETLGCGGLLAKYGAESGVIVLTDSDGVRRKDFMRAQEVWGSRAAHSLGLPDGSLDHDMHGLVGMLDEVLAEWQPEELYLPFPS